MSHSLNWIEYNIRVALLRRVLRSRLPGPTEEKRPFILSRAPSRKANISAHSTENKLKQAQKNYLKRRKVQITLPSISF
jgi:hypothetical protein